MKVVIIDDSEEQRGELKHLIEKNHSKCSVHEAKNGVNGLILIGKLSPEIVFLDLCMPDINGFASLRIIRAFDPQVYIAIVSTQSLRANVEAALHLKANTFIVKPCDPKLIAHHLAKALLSQNRTAEGADARGKKEAQASQVIMAEEARADETPVESPQKPATPPPTSEPAGVSVETEE